MIDNYTIKLVDNTGTTATFGTGITPNDVNITINKDATEGVFTAEVDIFSLSPDTFKAFATSNTVKPTKQIEISTTNHGQSNILFKGLIAETPNFDLNNHCFTFQAISTAIASEKIQISLKSTMTFKSLKLAFAKALKLKLSTNSISDNNVLGEDYKYYGSAVLTELKRIFPNENIYIAGGILCFQNKNNKQSQVISVPSYDITQHIIKPNYSNDMLAISCQCVYLPQIDVNDVVNINFDASYDSYFLNINGIYIVRKVQHVINISSFAGNNNALSNFDLLSSSKIVRL